MIKNRNIALDAAIDPSKILGAGMLGVGKVFWVAKKDSDAWNMLIDTVDSAYLFDGTTNNATHGIQLALDATVECRNDYVIVMPSDSDYDLTAALTMTKKAVHFICPAGLGNEIGATNACRLHQTTAATAVIAVSDASVEIAGFYLKSYAGCSHITLAALSYAPNIHHNTLMLSWTTSNDSAIACSGDAGSWGSIERNWIISQSGNNQTCAAVISINSSATGARCNYNEITIGDENIATIGISNGAVKGRTDFNTFSESGGAAVSSGGTITKCITIHATGAAIGNRAAVGTTQVLSGGTSAHSYSDNIGGVTGDAGQATQLES